MKNTEMTSFIKKLISENEISYVKVVVSLNEAILGCLYLNKEIVNGYKCYYEIKDNILYIQGLIVFDNVLDFYSFLSEEDRVLYEDLYTRAYAKSQMFHFEIMENNEIVETIEYHANRTLEIMDSGHTLYNYEGNVYYLFNSKEEAQAFIEDDDYDVPHAIQESIYEDDVEIDNFEWEAKNDFSLENISNS